MPGCRSRAAARSAGRIQSGGFARGAAVVLDVETGEVLASVSYPWPSHGRHAAAAAVPAGSAAGRALLDRARYGLYPPGSTFKLLVAAAALRSSAARLSTRRSPACGCRTDVSATTCADRRGRFATIRWTRPRTARSICATDSSSRATPTSRSWRCTSGRSRCSTRLRCSRSTCLSRRRRLALRHTLPQAGYGQGEVVVSPLKMARVVAAIAETRPGATSALDDRRRSAAARGAISVSRRRDHAGALHARRRHVRHRTDLWRPT